MLFNKKKCNERQACKMSVKSIMTIVGNLKRAQVLTSLAILGYLDMKWKKFCNISASVVLYGAFWEIHPVSMNAMYTND